jgi:hypothetical protein
MINKLPFLLTLFFISFQINSQTWTFNNGTLNGWNTTSLTPTYAPTSVLLTTSGSNPRISNLSANVNATINKFAVIKMKVAAGGPTLMRINDGTGALIVSRQISNGDTEFKTYYINISDPAWTGSINNIQLGFRIDNNTNGGATFSTTGIAIEIEEIKFVPNPYLGLTALYIDPINGNDNNPGTSVLSLKTIPNALNIAATNNISNVYIKSGTYDYSSTINISTISSFPITLSPEPGGAVTLNLRGFLNFVFLNDAKNIEIKGFTLDGKSNAIDHWTILAEYVWKPSNLSSNPNLSGGGIAFRIERAEDIKFTNNVIHDFYQKAVNIEDGRYITVKGNIIYNIAKTSLSGGHAIMRQQGSGSLSGVDDPSKYRWDLDGNLIFNVHQRIYSWVPTKGYLNMTLDEGKAILIDETPNHDQNMKARIINNIVAYGKIDGIRIKPTNNLEVSNNTVYSLDSHSDGLTDTTAGYNSNIYGSPFVNFKCFNNAISVNPIKMPYELEESTTSTGATFGNNYASTGNFIPTNAATNLNTQLFVNPESGNFNLVAGMPANIGSSPSTINDLQTRAAAFGIAVENDKWEHDHLKNFQTLYDNVPGIEDGIVGNESVFTDAGIYDTSDQEFTLNRKAYYFGVNPTWKTNNGISDAVLNQSHGLDAYDGKYEIIIPEEYVEWLEEIKANHLRDSDNNGTGDSPYDRIRYGESVIRQNKVFNNNSLHVVEIKSANDFTKTAATGYNVTVDGDILIDFKYSPVGNEVFDLLVANSITSANTSAIFDRIIIEGYTGTYTLEIVAGTPNILRLTLTNNTLTNPDFDLISNLKVFPNPSSQTEGFNVNIESEENIELKLFNSVGQEIDLIKNNTSFKPKNSLQSGVYLIKVTLEKSEKTFKWIIK